MTGLSAIFARISSPAGPSGSGFSGGPGQTPELRDNGNAGDVFERGLSWKNKATAESGGLFSSGCRCGNCLQCAARVYAAQDQRLAAEKGAGVTDDADETDLSGSQMAAGQDGDQSTEETDAARSVTSSQPKGRDGEPLSAEEVTLLMELKKADGEVRAHEQAHLAAAGGLAKGGANFSYRRGPDGRNYAVAGEVSIDTSKGDTPTETISKMDRVRAAALAPADPSPQDRKVAQAASVVKSEAVKDLRLEKIEADAREKIVNESSGEEADADAAGTSSTENEKMSGTTSVAMKGIASYRSVPQGQGAYHLTV